MVSYTDNLNAPTGKNMSEKKTVETSNEYSTTSKHLNGLVGNIRRIDEMLTAINTNKFPGRSEIINPGLQKRLSVGIKEEADSFEIRSSAMRLSIKTRSQRLEYNFVSGIITLDGKQICERRKNNEWRQTSDGDVDNIAAPAICAELVGRAALILEAYITKKSEIIGNPGDHPELRSLLKINELKREIADIPLNILYLHSSPVTDRKLRTLDDYHRYLLNLKNANIKLGGAFYRSVCSPLPKLQKKLDEQKHPKEYQSRIRKMIAEVLDVYSEQMTRTYYNFSAKKNEIQDLLTKIKDLLENLKDENLIDNVSDPYLNRVLGIADSDYEKPERKRPYR